MERESCNKFSGYSYLLKEHLFTSSDFICEKKKKQENQPETNYWENNNSNKNQKTLTEQNKPNKSRFQLC